MKYLIYDVCVTNQKDSTWISSDLLGVPLKKEVWLEKLMTEIKAYCECYESDDYKLTAEQFLMNMKQALTGQPITINGMEYIVEE